MHSIQKVSVGFLVLALVMGIGMSVVFAQDATTTDDTSTTTDSTSDAVSQIADLLKQINDLRAQILELQAKQGELRQQLVEAVQLTRSLSRGMTGDDVTALQELLASDPELYPEGLVTGFFGPLTEKAVERLQERFGIEQVGIVGPITRGTLNQLFKHFNRGKGSLNSGKGNFFKNFFEDDDDEDGDDDIPGGEIFGKKGHKVRVCHGGNTLVVAIPALQAHLAHGDSIGSCGDLDDDDDGDEDDDDEDMDDDDNGTTTPDTTAPQISDIEVRDIRTTGAEIRWDTNEDADSTVWYGTSTPIDTDTADSEHSSVLEDSHEIDLTGLTASTTYYFIVGSEDDAGNEAVSSERSFTTLPPTL